MNQQVLIDCVKTQMPFGKYKGQLIADLPVFYLEWFNRQGFPAGKLGMLMSTVFEIKTNGLDEILYKIKEIAATSS